MLCHPTKQISINQKIICEENIKELNLKTISKCLLPKGIEEFLGNFSEQAVCIYTSDWIHVRAEIIQWRHTAEM